MGRDLVRANIEQRDADQCHRWDDSERRDPAHHHPDQPCSNTFVTNTYTQTHGTAQFLTQYISNITDVLRVRYPAANLVVCGDFNHLDISNILLNLIPIHQKASFITTDLN